MENYQDGDKPKINAQLKPKSRLVVNNNDRICVSGIYQCARCQYVSRSNSNMTRHVESHHSENQCKFCFKSLGKNLLDTYSRQKPDGIKIMTLFSTGGRTNLVKHLKKEHNYKTTLSNYFSGVDRAEKSRAVKNKSCTERKKKQVISSHHADEAVKAEVAFEKSVNLFLRKGRKSVITYPLRYHEQPWEFSQRLSFM